MNILIVDDHLLFVEGIKCLLGSLEGETRTHSVNNTEAALNYITNEEHPDLVLLDIQLSAMDGHGLLKELKLLRINTSVLMISSLEVPAATGVALAQGASGFISKSSNHDVLLSAIKTVLGGDIYMHCEEKTKSEYARITVTNRQQEILYLLSQGMLNKQIAHELCISANTVKAHLHQIFRTLNVNNRTAAVQHAYEKGLL